MPIKIPDSLPATAVLESENIFVMTEYRAMHQDIRPLNVLILNLMPTKIVTETQILRKLSNTPVQIEVELLRTASYQSQHTDEDHLASFYTTFDQIKEQNFDGMIITGAPVENLETNFHHQSLDNCQCQRKRNRKGTSLTGNGLCCNITTKCLNFSFYNVKTNASSGNISNLFCC